MFTIHCIRVHDDEFEVGNFFLKIRYNFINIYLEVVFDLGWKHKNCKEWKRRPKQFLSCDWFVVSLMLFGSSNFNCIYLFRWRWSVCPGCYYCYIAIIFTFKNNLLFLCIPWDNEVHFSLCSKYTCPKWFVWKSTNPLILFFPHFSLSSFVFFLNVWFHLDNVFSSVCLLLCLWNMKTWWQNSPAELLVSLLAIRMEN